MKETKYAGTQTEKNLMAAFAFDISTHEALSLHDNVLQLQKLGL